jgi:hypothetical protein
MSDLNDGQDTESYISIYACASALTELFLEVKNG